jgi:hypothetical protein
MMRRTRVLAIGIVLSWAAACGENKPPERNVLDAPAKALKKARAVGAQLDQAADERREQIERAGEAGN